MISAIFVRLAFKLSDIWMYTIQRWWAKKKCDSLDSVLFQTDCPPIFYPTQGVQGLVELIDYCFFFQMSFFCIQPPGLDHLPPKSVALWTSELLQFVRRKAWKSSTTGNWTTNGSRQLSLVGWISSLGGYNFIGPPCLRFWNSNFWHVPDTSTSHPLSPHVLQISVDFLPVSKPNKSQPQSLTCGRDDLAEAICHITQKVMKAWYEWQLITTDPWFCTAHRWYTYINLCSWNECLSMLCILICFLKLHIFYIFSYTIHPCSSMFVNHYILILIYPYFLYIYITFWIL